ncbi:hypothetical protein [Alteribacter aurantiacus]|uniref:hypothetical protein n=1 Tax=Alteribacter aurantiacus TaxID=254410 RepID=UPI000424E1EA|nr:hypothetical protein [Alteribacter aurantiacus]
MRETNRLLAYTAVAVLLIVGFSFLAFSSYLNPKLEARDRAVTNLHQEDQLVTQLEAERAELEKEQAARTTTSTDLQRRLPVVSLTDQFLMDINMAEEVAGVRMMNLTMDKDEPVHDMLETSSTPATIEHTETVVVVEEDEELDVESGEEQDPIEEIEEERVLVPGEWKGEPIEGMYKQTAHMDVRVDTYDHLVRFLHELDHLTRITNVESVYFSKEDTTDGRMIVDGEDHLDFHVIVSTYYYPELTDLEHEAPKGDYPPFEDRDQPFLD